MCLCSSVLFSGIIRTTMMAVLIPDPRPALSASSPIPPNAGMKCQVCVCVCALVIIIQLTAFLVESVMEVWAVDNDLQRSQDWEGQPSLCISDVFSTPSRQRMAFSLTPSSEALMSVYRHGFPYECLCVGGTLGFILWTLWVCVCVCVGRCGSGH